MKGDFVRLDAVDFSLGLGETHEHLQRELADARRERALADQLANVAKRSMEALAMRVAMRMPVRRMVVVDFDHELRRPDSAALSRLTPDAIAANVELGELALERGDVEPTIEQGSDRHVA